MGIKKYALGLLIILCVLVSGCKKHVLVDETDSNLLNYSFKVTNIQDLDKELSKQKYTYSTTLDKRYAAIIIVQSDTATVNQYQVVKDGTLDLAVPKDSDFIISLPANSTIAYTWNIKNSINNELIKFNKRSGIGIPLPKSEEDKIGVSYDRQNFYFKTVKTGNEKVIMRYEHQTEQRNEDFKITFNIKVK